MVQLKNKRKILIIVIAAAVLLIIIWWMLKIKSDRNNESVIKPSGRENKIRLMTDQEKEERKLDKNQVLQVVNDKEGHFIYKVVK